MDEHGTPIGPAFEQPEDMQGDDRALAKITEQDKQPHLQVDVSYDGAEVCELDFDSAPAEHAEAKDMAVACQRLSKLTRK